MKNIVKIKYAMILMPFLFLGCYSHIGNFSHLGIENNKNIESKNTQNQIIFNKECNINKIYICQINALESIYKVFKLQDKNFTYLKNIKTLYIPSKNYMIYEINKE